MKRAGTSAPCSAIVQPPAANEIAGVEPQANWNQAGIANSGALTGFNHYDVILYFDGYSGTATRVSNYRLTSLVDGAIHGCPAQGQDGGVATGTDAAGVDFSGTFVQASGGSAGNYVKFLTCTGSSFSLEPIHAGSSDNQCSRPINGRQILAHQ